MRSGVKGRAPRPPRSLPSLSFTVVVAAVSVPFGSVSLPLPLRLSQMNHAAAGKRHAQELLETLYRELAILGIVAFILWSINVSPAVDIEVCIM